MTTDIETAINIALDAVRMGGNGHGYLIVDVPAIGPDGKHYREGCRVFKDTTQEPRGLDGLPPGPIVARVSNDGQVSRLRGTA